MTLSVTHTFVSPIADAGDPNIVGPDEWNATHSLSGTLSAAQMPALTGDITTPGASLATTLATVNGNVGTFGSATKASVVTVNAKGLVTAASESTVTPAASSITGGAALTKVDDTNVTLTLGGTPTSALLASTSLTLGWTGTLSKARGGTATSDWLASPTFTGTPAGPTAAAGTTTTQFATTAFAMAALGGFVLVGGKLTGTVGSSALTIAIKTNAGNDPSANEAVYVVFRNATVATGDFTVITLTAATSLVISSGSTMGTTNNVPFRIWVVGFNDGGTFRLGAIVCTVSGFQYALAEWGVASSTAEGGAGAADSAGVFYTGTAATSKAFRILGFMTWDSGLATAGTWASGPTVIQLFGAGVARPGETIQSTQTVSTGNTSTTSSTLTASGVTVTLTPTSAANPVYVKFESNLKVTTSALAFGYSSITRGGTVIGSESITGASADQFGAAVRSVTDYPGTTSSTTWTMSFRNNDNSTTINIGSIGQSGIGTTMQATEIMG